MIKEYKIGLYDESKNLIGYKADSFWSLSKTYAKLHSIPLAPNLLSNLTSVLKIKPENHRASQAGALINCISQHNKNRFFDRFETMLIGCTDPENESLPPIFTHRVFSDGIEELTEEDQLRLTKRSRNLKEDLEFAERHTE